MASLESPTPLKGMLCQVKYMLEDEGKRLQEEIFKTSASGSSSIRQDENRVASADIKKTMRDISILNSVLSCPIFNRIVNVKDSLDKLSYHLSLHPSISPSDMSIDANGELILAPPIEPLEQMEPTALNNIINNKLTEYSDYSNFSPQMISPNINHNNQILLNDPQICDKSQPSSGLGGTNEVGCSNGFSQVQSQEQTNNFIDQSQNYTAQSQLLNSQNFSQKGSNTGTSYNNEKLVFTNSKVSHGLNGDKSRQNQVSRVDMDESKNSEVQRLYKSNGSFDQSQPTDDLDSRTNFRNTQSINQINEHSDDQKGNGFSNELYRTTDELNQPEKIAIAHKNVSIVGHNYSPLAQTKNIKNRTVVTIGKTQTNLNSGVVYNRGSCSPSSSAGSTVRLADDCDSGASSLNHHHNARLGLYSPVSHKQDTSHLDEQSNYANSSISSRAFSEEQSKAENMKEGMEKIKVTLEKDSSGLGITIAGYTCEREVISGIFIKYITPNSPADRSGRVRLLDQIYAVDGREILGYTNKEAVEIMRNTGKVVTLELMRHLAESKYQNLQTALAAVPYSQQVYNDHKLIQLLQS